MHPCFPKIIYEHNSIVKLISLVNSITKWGLPKPHEQSDSKGKLLGIHLYRLLSHLEEKSTEISLELSTYEM